MLCCKILMHWKLLIHQTTLFASGGRVKPDIAANGRDQMSTDENKHLSGGGWYFCCLSGIAGICTLQLIQTYKQINSASDAPTFD